LWFAGFGPVRIKKFGYIKNSGVRRREKIKKKVSRLGSKAR